MRFFWEWMLAMTANAAGSAAARPYYSAPCRQEASVPSATAPTEPTGAPRRRGRRRSVALNTAIFSIATGLSRVAGLFREILASSYFATSGAFSAFTIAFQVPNLVRMLVRRPGADGGVRPGLHRAARAGQAPRDAFRLASTLFFLILAVLGAITALFILARAGA